MKLIKIKICNALQELLLYFASFKKQLISDLTCVGCPLAMLTGHMIPFWNPF